VRVSIGRGGCDVEFSRDGTGRSNERWEEGMGPGVPDI
jgi:hypothetical protein